MNIKCKNIKCKKCGRVLGTISGFYQHWSKRHEGSSTGMCEKTTKDVTQPWRGPWKGERGKRRRGEQKQHNLKDSKIITPETTFIDVPMILRIPMTLGQGRILEVRNGNN